MSKEIDELNTWNLNGTYRYQYGNDGLEDYNVDVSPENIKLMVLKINELVETVNTLREEIDELKGEQK